MHKIPAQRCRGHSLTACNACKIQNGHQGPQNGRTESFKYSSYMYYFQVKSLKNSFFWLSLQWESFFHTFKKRESNVGSFEVEVKAELDKNAMKLQNCGQILRLWLQYDTIVCMPRKLSLAWQIIATHHIKAGKQRACQKLS